MKRSHWSLVTKGENSLCYEHMMEVRINAFRPTHREEIAASVRSPPLKDEMLKARS